MLKSIHCHTTRNSVILLTLEINIDFVYFEIVVMRRCVMEWDDFSIQFTSSANSWRG